MLATVTLLGTLAVATPSDTIGTVPYVRCMYLGTGGGPPACFGVAACAARRFAVRVELAANCDRFRADWPITCSAALPAIGVSQLAEAPGPG